ncbi:MAG: hypothetical protein AABZ78_01240 [Chloroflexota bacterium]
MKSKQKTIQDDVVITCPKCGHKHSFVSLAALDKVPPSTPCAGCGFLFLQHLANKMKSILTLLKSDSKAVTLLRDGKIEDFEKYLKEKTGL